MYLDDNQLSYVYNYIPWIEELRYKVRLAVKSFTQVVGIDHRENS